MLLWPAKGKASRSRFFMRPPGENLIGFGVLPAIPPRFWERARPTLDNVSRLTELMGGKRYLSGYIDFAPEELEGALRRRSGTPFRAAQAQVRSRLHPESRVRPGRAD